MTLKDCLAAKGMYLGTKSDLHMKGPQKPQVILYGKKGPVWFRKEGGK